MLAMPSAHDSRPLFARGAVRSSTRLAVRSVSNNPTKATLSAVGHTICSVSQLNATVNGVIDGRPGAIVPSPPTLGTERWPTITIAVTTTIAISGAGTA